MHKKGSGKPFREPSGSWAFRWRESGRLRYSGGHDSKRTAERVQAVIQGQLALERTGLPPDPKTSPELSAILPGWLDRRQETHAAAAEDRGRWENHLEPFFGRLRPAEVDAAKIRRWVETKRAELKPGTVRVCLSILSSAYEDMIERRLATVNPCRNLPRSLRRLVQPDHDPRTTPFIERLADVRRIFVTLDEPLNVAYAIGAMAGLRTGEVFALRWVHVDLDARRIHVRESVKGPLKDKDSRIVPILDGLLPVLAAWRLKTGGQGRVIPSLRRDGHGINKGTPGPRLAAVLTQLGLARDGLGWYEATRHTFASQWVLAGGTIEKLSKILGHASIQQTEVYAHLRPDLYVDAERTRIPLILVQKTSGEPKKLRRTARKH